MRTLTSRIFRVRPGEAGLLLLMGILLLLNSFALQLSDVVSVTGFLSEVGVREILIVWIVDMTLIIIAASGQSLFIDRFNRVTLLRGMIIAFALVYVLLRLMFSFGLPPWVNFSLLFLLAEQQWLFFPLIFWILANDVYDLSQGKRLFPLIAALGFVGQILGFVVAAAAPGLLARFNITTSEILNINVLIFLVMYLLSGLLTRIKVRTIRRKPETLRETMSEGWGFVRDVPSFRYLMLSMLMGGAVITVLEYHFLVVTTSSITQPGEFQTFYSLIRMLEAIVAIIMQTFITSRIINRIGLKNAFVILPVLVVVGVGWVLALPGVFSATSGWLTTKTTFNTLDQSARKSLQALVPEERRGRVSFFMDSWVLGVSVILGSVITGLIVIAGQVADSTMASVGYLLVAAVMAIFGLVAIIRMWQVYEVCLFNWRLKRRQRSASVLDKLSF